MTTIRNLTPHDVIVVLADGNKNVYSPCGVVARAEQHDELIGHLEDGTPIFRTVMGKPIDLPDPEEGVLLVVSRATAISAAEYGRTTADLRLPTRSVRNEAGQIIGCEGLSVY